MVNMERSKYCKLRRGKGSSKRKKSICVDECSEPTIEQQGTAGTSAITTPPRHSTIIERRPDEVRGVEWQYHGKFVEKDIPVVWGSPHGSPVVNIGKVYESPVDKGRRRTLSSAPRKLNTEECEPPQFLNEILALSEKIKAEEKVDENSSGSPINEQNELMVSNNVSEESFSNFFDEDMNEYMLKCSQELEEFPLQNIQLPAEWKGKEMCENDCETRKAVVESGTSRTSPRKNISVNSASKSLINTASGVFYLGENVTDSQKNTSRVGNKNYVLCNRKANTYVFQGRVLGSEPNGDRACVASSPSGPLKSNSSHLCKNSSKILVKPQKSVKSNRSQLSLDNSFETVKESFLDDDLDLLSAIPDDLEMVLSQNSESPVRKSLGLSEPKQQGINQLPSASGFDDSTYFEDGVLQYLDSIESSMTSTQPLRCTPEEIEKKRQEAKLKLRRKHMIAKK